MLDFLCRELSRRCFVTNPVHCRLIDSEIGKSGDPEYTGIAMKGRSN
jgi:hypothetical protein